MLLDWIPTQVVDTYDSFVRLKKRQVERHSAVRTR